MESFKILKGQTSAEEAALARGHVHVCVRVWGEGALEKHFGAPRLKKERIGICPPAKARAQYKPIQPINLLAKNKRKKQKEAHTSGER